MAWKLLCRNSQKSVCLGLCSSAPPCCVEQNWSWTPFPTQALMYIVLPDPASAIPLHLVQSPASQWFWNSETPKMVLRLSQFVTSQAGSTPRTPLTLNSCSVHSKRLVFSGFKLLCFPLPWCPRAEGSIEPSVSLTTRCYHVVRCSTMVSCADKPAVVPQAEPQSESAAARQVFTPPLWGTFPNFSIFAWLSQRRRPCLSSLCHW